MHGVKYRAGSYVLLSEIHSIHELNGVVSALGGWCDAQVARRDFRRDAMPSREYVSVMVRPDGVFLAPAHSYHMSGRALSAREVLESHKEDKGTEGALRAERDHTAKLTSWIQDVQNAWRHGDTGFNAYYADHVEMPRARYQSVDSAINADAKTSLAQRDARVLREASEEFFQEFGGHEYSGHTFVQWLDKRADEIASGGAAHA